MKQYYYINADNEEVLNLEALLQRAFDYEISEESITKAIKFLNKHIKINPLKNE